MTSKPVFHGSDIEKICSFYHLKKENIINFGANVNPLGLPKNVQKELASHLFLLSSYPDREYSSLRNALSQYCSIPADFVLPGNGSSELISLLIEAVNPRHTLILGPTYSEYSRELSFSGSTETWYHLEDSSDFALDIQNLCLTLEKDYDFLIMCNPNNPTSSAVTQEKLRKILTFCRQKEIFVMIDETYVEFAPDPQLITAVPLTREFENLMVLRGVSKFFAAPGMRLGYGITGNKELLSKIKNRQIPWSINSLGAFAGELLVQDKDYISRTRQLILKEREKLYQELLKPSSFKVFPAFANFLLLKIIKPGLTASNVFEACIRQNLMIRDCSSFQCLDGEFVRFCIMLPEHNEQLLNVLKGL